MRKRTAIALLKWFAGLPELLQSQILCDAIKRRQGIENDARRRNEKPDPALFGARQLQCLVDAIASIRQLTDFSRLKTRDATSAAELAVSLAKQTKLRHARKSEFLSKHMGEILDLQSKGMSFRGIQAYIHEHYRIRISLGLLHLALSELKN